ncbi:DNA-3-methyladenine glycosylase isoform X2 [Monomorium pharaonis]|uniref:DNA-3-methyladenine glycosylase isoform X2 n=1 Tax=Monomorium pharaonis TaxID=307658 RepID=UPI00063F9677|nr:DNA-3-methyladenine glycosylase isoform X2 [Monomorium pharaonis]
MKRTRTGARNNKNENDNAEDTKIQSTLVASEKTKLNLKSLRSTENAYYMADTQTTAFSKRSRSSQKETGTHIEKTEKEFKRKKVVDLQMMKAELSQLEDPPITLWDKKLSSSRLQYKFFDIPCEELAQHLLGKVLVRYLENGTILKGRIVETEGYLGAIDKASHSYQYKITPRNLPMYMPPGTIYIYMTYGMYHCFNISSQGLPY